jgi:hypothetical protein
VVELSSDDDSPDGSGGRVAGKVDDAPQTSAGAGASAGRRQQVVRSESQTAARTKVQVPDALGGGWMWIRRLLSMLNGGATVSKDRLLRSRHGSTFDEGGGGTKAIAKLESRGSRGFREISDFELELASASL